MVVRVDLFRCLHTIATGELLLRYERFGVQPSLRSKGIRMKRHFIAAALLALCLFASTVQAQVVISEFRTSGPEGVADEFIELYNAGESPVDISGWMIDRSDNAGNVATMVTIPASTSIPPHSFYLIAGSTYSGAETPDLAGALDIEDDGGIGFSPLSEDDDIDQVGLSAGSSLVEGTILAVFSGTGSYERKALAASTSGTMYAGIDRYAGNGYDTDDNLADFVSQAVATPQNSSSAIEGLIIHNLPSDGYAALLQDALAIVQGGDEVSVPSGTYTGEMNVNTTNITIVGVGVSKPVIANASGHGFVVADGISNVTIDNFQITVMDNGVRSVSSVGSPSSMVSVLNTDISGGTVGISLQYSNSVTISGTTINENTTGILVHNSATVSVTGSTINSNATGMDINTSSGVTLSNSSVKTNTFGIEIDAGSFTISITNSDLAGNSNTTLLNNSSTTVLATGNWWGSADGPSHPSNKYNVSSQGGVVYGNANIAPWAGAADDGSDADGWQPSEPLFEAVKAYDDDDDQIGTFASIQAAIEAVELAEPDVAAGGAAFPSVQSSPPSGMRVEAVAGTFTEQLNLDSDGMLVKGREEDPTVISAGGGVGITLSSIGPVSLFNLEVTSASTGILALSSDPIDIEKVTVTGATDGIKIENSSNVTMESSSLDGNTTGITLNNVSGFTALNNFIRNNTTGVRVEGTSATVTLSYTSFAGNEIGVQNLSAAVVAQLNWWGGTAGPAHASNANVTNLGSAVSDEVHYSPWLALGTDGSLEPGFQRAQPVTFGVNTSTGSTIQLAIDVAIPHENAEDPGDVVRAYSGTYFENVVINKAGLTLEGAGPTRPVISVESDRGIHVETTHTAVSNVEIVGGNTGIFAENAEGVNILNSYIHNSGTGVELVNSPFATISGNTISENGGVGVYINTSSSVLVSNNPSISLNGAIGIYVLNSSNSASISNNTVHANAVDGILVESSHSASVTGNTANSNGDHDYFTGSGIRVSGSSHTVNSNTTNLNAEYGISADAGSGVTVSGNTANGNGVAGLYIGGLSGLSNSQISNNTANENAPTVSGVGIKVINSDFNTFQENTTNQNDIGLSLQSSDGNKILSSTIGGNSRGVALSNTNSTRLYGNTITANSGIGVDQNGGSDNQLIDNTISANGSSGYYHTGGESSGNRAIFNRISGNSTFGIESDGDPVDGRYNWWGHASGPSGGLTDDFTARVANGSGDAVTGNVRFDPFFGASVSNANSQDFGASGNPLLTFFEPTGVAIDFSNTGTGGTVVVGRVNQAPPPGTITDPDATGLSFTILGVYWEVVPLGDMSGFTADILFDFDGVSGITNPANLRLAKRVGFASGGVGWVLIPVGQTHVDLEDQTVTASGQTDFGQWALVQVGEISPTFVSVAPTVLTAGQANVLVTINGTGFLTGITTVDFGEGIVVNAITVNSSAELVADVSAAAGAIPGPRDVVVSNGPGLTVTEVSGITVVPAAATLVSLAPNSGMPGQTFDVTVTGQFFYTGLTTVGFGGGIGVNSVTVNSSSQLTANITVAANAALGPRNVSVSNDGTTFSTLTNGFTVVSTVPALTTVAPAIGSRGESLSVDLTGANFVAGTTTVSFGDGITVDSISVVSATEITAHVSIDVAASTGPRDIVISNGSTASVTGTGAFTVVNPAPSITGVSPQLATKGATVDVEITGTGLMSDVTSVSFGVGITVNSLTVASMAQASASITVDPTASTGVRDVTVVNATPGGGTVALSGGFTVGNVAPALTGVSPASAIRGSILNVTVTGTGFETGVTTVSFGDDISVNTLSVTGSGELVATIAIGATAATGARPVSVTNAAPGGGEVSLAGAFTVETGTPSRAENMLDLIPEVFVLHEAYPNPFNPATKIRYAIPEGARVKLEIYNMLGNVVAALVEGEKQKGYYEITWVAENQPSGVYLVRMQAEGLESQKRFIGSRKLVLVK